MVGAHPQATPQRRTRSTRTPDRTDDDVGPRDVANRPPSGGDDRKKSSSNPEHVLGGVHRRRNRYARRTRGVGSRGLTRMERIVWNGMVFLFPGLRRRGVTTKRTTTTRMKTDDVYLFVSPSRDEQVASGELSRHSRVRGFRRVHVRQRAPFAQRTPVVLVLEDS